VSVKSFKEMIYHAQPVGVFSEKWNLKKTILKIIEHVLSEHAPNEKIRGQIKEIFQKYYSQIKDNYYFLVY